MTGTTLARKSLNEKDIRTILAVFDSILEHCHHNWSELNTFMGSLTIEEMMKLRKELDDWNHRQQGHRFDPEFGWYDPQDMIF